MLILSTKYLPGHTEISVPSDGSVPNQGDAALTMVMTDGDDIRCSYIFVLSFPFVLRSILILTFDHTVTLVIANLKILRTDTDTTHTYNKNH